MLVNVLCVLRPSRPSGISMPHACVGKSGKPHVQGRLGASGPVPRRSLARDDASAQLNQTYAQTCLACQSSSATLTNSLSNTNPALCYTRRLQRLFLPDIGVAAHLPWPALGDTQKVLRGCPIKAPRCRGQSRTSHMCVPNDQGTLDCQP